MSTGYMLRQLSKAIGGDLTDVDTRTWLLDYLNKAAKAFYKQGDLPGCLREGTFQVTPAKQIALPSYVGLVRAARESTSKIPWTIHDMRPRYHLTNWGEMWRSFRDKGVSPVMQDSEIEGYVTITVPAVESPPVVISVVGSNQQSARVVDSIILDDTSKQSLKTYADYAAFQKDRRNDYDATITDSQGVVLAIIDNDQLSSYYKLLDVSDYPSSFDGDGCNCMEVLYKLRYRPLSNDQDEFIVPGDYDDIIVMKAVSLWAGDNPGQEQKAVLSDGLVDRELGRDVKDKEGGRSFKLEFEPHPHDVLLKGRRWRRHGSWDV